MTAPTVSPAAEVRRLRAELADLQQRYDQLLAATAPDMATDLAWWLDVFQEIHQADLDDAYRRGRKDEARERDRAWHEAADPIAHSGPTHAELEFLRWGPSGRARFGDPRPGDYMGGRVDWQPKAGAA